MLFRSGLATGSILPNVVLYIVLALISGNQCLSLFCNVPTVEAGQIALFGAALFGSCLGFLWFNAHPAQIFMGDVGSLALGATLACMAIFIRQELLLPIAGIVFVGEVVSVIIQCIAIKRYKQKIFKMAPVHHHFELMGLQEPKIMIRFVIVSILMSCFALVVALSF